ncbi:amidase [Pseudogemmobacter humi]|uniref:Glutamyl-tRNA(Gln) amidotransferase subunit A n=1 Tax=Pseudogemmobacter humi TaxID=2483812 RepID=A0A3P5X7A0_9RHOB|nr:amidase [Pseudogemmobacter humi]VDC30513.1 Glutamyl-tRNA(Gln) amidotransferase subunit A [Pseudogemmobacter humi]
MQPEIFELGLAGAARLVRQGVIGFEDLARACLERAAHHQALNAWERLLPDQALAAARAQQMLLDAGYDLGPLQGIPLGIKSNIDLAGLRTSAGGRLASPPEAGRDAAVIARLRQAGAVILGTTNMDEFAWGGTTSNPHYGQTLNPHDPLRIPAGSSGGSGVAVATGSAFAALGTDTGGSVRLPAAMNGLFGLRPGLGSVSVEGVFPLAWSLDTVGPLARSAEDAGLLFNAMTGTAAPRRLRGLQGLRIGLFEEYTLSALHPDVGARFEALLAACTGAGAAVIPLPLEGITPAVDALVIVDAVEPSAVHDHWRNSESAAYGDTVARLLDCGHGFSGVEYLHAQRYRTWLRAQMLRHLAGVDLLLMPTVPYTAPLIGETEEVDLGNGRRENALTANMRFTCIPSLTGLPALSLPIGCDRQGLPVGAQIIGAPQSEGDLFALAGEMAALCA